MPADSIGCSSRLAQLYRSNLLVEGGGRFMAASRAPAKGRASIERCEALSEVLADKWWAVGLRGLLGIAFGLICFLVPAAAILALILLFSAYMLVDGALAIASGIKAARNDERWGLLILEGVVDLAAGAIAFLWPAITAVAFVILIAVWAIISGALMLGAAFTLKLDHGRWWLALGGIASIIFGIVLLVAPVVGAVVLTWWIGAYAIVFGAFLLILAFQLHGKKEEREMKTPATRTAAKKA
jgi:uncharacterized membrane protein HdeD (DUF308 family)